MPGHGNDMKNLPQLALGPILYYWPKQKIEDFYQRLASTAVDIVYLGETVCSKRRIMRTNDWIRIGEQLQAQGKTVILSTLTLLEAASELSALKSLCAKSPFLIEANDIAAVQVLSELGKPFVTGPSVNIYNSRTLQKLSEKGLRRWTLPSPPPSCYLPPTSPAVRCKRSLCARLRRCDHVFCMQIVGCRDYDDINVGLLKHNICIGFNAAFQIVLVPIPLCICGIAANQRPNFGAFIFAECLYILSRHPAAANNANSFAM